MKKTIGKINKLVSHLKSPIEYHLPLGDARIHLNPYLGKTIRLHYQGEIQCIQCGRKTKKSFQQGHCFPCFRKIAECDNCLIFPERCHAAHTVCPNEWPHLQCMAKHFVYLANTSGLKVGITRDHQIPTRWIDQGAIQAIPIFSVSNRYQAGVVEVAFKSYVADKTNWRVMLSGEPKTLNLIQLRDELFDQAKTSLADVMQKFSEDDIQTLDDADVTHLEYPVLEYPEKISLFNLDKSATIEGTLLGIKGQYLILDTGLINIRKFSGYLLEFGVS